MKFPQVPKYLDKFFSGSSGPEEAYRLFIMRQYPYNCTGMSGKTQILGDAQVKQILKRLAYQVYEKNFNEKELIIAGVEGRGSRVAEMLCSELASICKIRLHTTEIVLDKSNPQEKQVILSDPSVKAAGKVAIVVDDVLNTGKTLLYALIPFVKDKSAKIQTLVLVDRNHKTFPVAADYIGTQLSTTLQEHIEVNIEKGKVSVYLK